MRHLLIFLFPFISVAYGQQLRNTIPATVKDKSEIEFIKPSYDGTLLFNGSTGDMYRWDASINVVPISEDTILRHSFLTDIRKGGWIKVKQTIPTLQSVVNAGNTTATNINYSLNTAINTFQGWRFLRSGGIPAGGFGYKNSEFVIGQFDGLFVPTTAVYNANDFFKISSGKYQTSLATGAGYVLTDYYGDGNLTMRPVPVGTVLSGNGYVRQNNLTTSYVNLIPNSDLANSSITINGTQVPLGGSYATPVPSQNLQSVTDQGDSTGNRVVARLLKTDSIITTAHHLYIDSVSVNFKKRILEGSSTKLGTSLLGIGDSSLMSAVNAYNCVGFGGYTLAQNTSGYSNSAFGTFALYHNTTGKENTAIGYWSMINNVSGNSNVTMGVTSMRYNTSGSNNTSIGRQALYVDSTGNANVALGYMAGFSTQGSNNVFLGYMAGYSEIGSNKLYIANSNTAIPLIYGDFSASQLKVNGTFSTTGKITAPASITSSASLNIPSGIAPTTFMNGDLWQADNHLYARLNGVSYQLDQQSGSSSGVTSIAGTVNQVLSSASTGAVTLSLPQSIATTSNVTFANITSNSFIKSGGTTSQFLKADGSVDANIYLTSSALAGYELLSNKSTSIALGISNTLYPTQNAVKTYVDNRFSSYGQHPVSSGNTPSIVDNTPSGTLSTIAINGTDAALTFYVVVASGQSVNGSLCTISYVSPWASRPKVVIGWNAIGGYSYDNILVSANAVDNSTIDVVAQIPSPGIYQFTIMSMQ